MRFLSSSSKKIPHLRGYHSVYRENGRVAMNMDRSQKNLEKKKDDRTIEYLELKYDTNIQRGLTLAKVRQKQRGKRSSRNSITKEKKRIWFMCLKQECQNLLFFFFLYLCVVSVLFQFDQRVKTVLFVSFMVFLFGKVEKTFRYSKVLFKKEEIYKTKVVVLRENIFQCVQVNSLVKGDIVRLKRGEKVPLAVISLKLPYKEYKQGEIFAENTGRAIVTQQVVYPFFENVKENTGINRTVKMTENIEDKYVEKNESMKGKISLNTIGKQRKKQGRLYAAEEKEREENGGSYTENMILQEIFIRQGIYFQPDFLKKTAVEGERPIVAVGFEDIYFPSRFQKEKFQRFMQELKKTGVKYFFFTNQNRESAFSIGKQTGIVKEKREVIDRKQFLLLKNVALEKQIKSIRIYCGLSEVEKSQIIAIWRKHQQEYSKKFLQKQGRILFMSGLNQSGREKITEDCVYACCHSGSQEGDIWFKKNWRDTIVKYLTGQNIWQKFLENTQKWEGQILASLCIFMLISLLLSLYMPQQENMQKITQTGSLFCAAYIIGKEIVEEGFRKWFLKKLKNN